MKGSESELDDVALGRIRGICQQLAGFNSSPHHGDRGWLAIALDDLDVVHWDEIAELLESGYRQVATRSVIDE